MKCNTRCKSTVAVMASARAEEAIRAYADLLTAHHNRRIAPIRLAADPSTFRDDAPAAGTGRGAIRGAIADTARTERIDLIVAEWMSNPGDMQTVLRSARELAVPVVFIRHPEIRPRGRVLVATAGGPHVLQQMWIARAVACGLDIPVSHLRVLHPDVIPTHPASAETPAAAIDACACRLLQMEARMEVKRSANVAETIVASVRDGDLLVLGAPSALRLTSDFAGSLPQTVAENVHTPLILLSAPADKRLSMRRLFWGGLIKTRQRFRNKEHALSVLIENLAVHNQIPRSRIGEILDRALRREAVMSSAADGETAFPLVTLPGFFGVVGSMAICPDGVAFDSPDGHPTRFFYLLVTPDGLCTEYLATLAMIARRMINPGIRRDLLACHSPAQVLDILEPRAGTALQSGAAIAPRRQDAAAETEKQTEARLNETVLR